MVRRVVRADRASHRSSRSARCSTSRPMPTAVQRSSTARATQARHRGRGRRCVRARRHRRLDRGAAASLRARRRAAQGRGIPLHADARRRALRCSATAVRCKTVPAGATGRFSETLFVGPKLQDSSSGRPEARAHRRLRQAHDPRRAAVLAVTEGARNRRQLGLGDHHRHVPDQAAVLQADRDERPLDGEDAHHRAAHQEHPGAIQGRPRAARAAR